jgi:hypothetical protein
MKISKSAVFALGLCIVLTCELYPVGLSTPFGELEISNLEIGKSYSVKNLTGVTLKVTNTGNEPVDIKIDVVIPQVDSLKKGYEALPDSSWVKLEKDYFPQVKPKERAETDIHITIPNSYLYLGKKYQVYLWSHTTGEGGTIIAVGLNSRLLLNTSSEQPVEKPKEEKPKKNFLQKFFSWLGM